MPHMMAVKPRFWWLILKRNHIYVFDSLAWFAYYHCIWKHLALLIYKNSHWSDIKNTVLMNNKRGDILWEWCHPFSLDLKMQRALDLSKLYHVIFRKSSEIHIGKSFTFPFNMPIILQHKKVARVQPQYNK